MPYFEDITLFKHGVQSDYPGKTVPRISVDMGLGVFLHFVMNECYLFSLKWATDKKAYGPEIDRIMKLINMAKELTGNVENYYSMLDYFRTKPLLNELAKQLESTSYHPNFWNDMASFITETYVPITEDQE